MDEYLLATNEYRIEQGLDPIGPTTEDEEGEE